MDYWAWLLGREGHSGGWRRFANWYLVVHISIGTLLATAVTEPIERAANTVLLPLASLFIGLCFAWGGNAIALLQTQEIEKLARNHERGPMEFPFAYQTAILVMMVAVGSWGVAGLGVFEQKWLMHDAPWAYGALETSLYAWSSLTLRECWHVVLGAQYKLIARMEIKAAEERAAVERANTTKT